MHKITVIIPVYNVEKYVNRCIESVVNQKYKNLEIILIDDGSPDGSSAICDEWTQKDTRIRTIHKKNEGISAARNSGIDIATGDYFCFIDSDDYVAEDFVESLYNSIISNDADVAVCDFLEVNDDTGNISQKPEKERLVGNTCTGKEYIDKYINNDDLFYGVVWNKIYKRNLFSDLKFIKGKNFEDAFIIPQIFAKCKKVNCISKPLYFYLRRDGSITGHFSLKHLDFLEAQDFKINFFIKNNWNELLCPSLVNLLNAAIFVYKNARNSKTLSKNDTKCLIDSTIRVMNAKAKLFLSSKDIKLKHKIRFLRYYFRMILVKFLNLY